MTLPLFYPTYFIQLYTPQTLDVQVDDIIELHQISIGKVTNADFKKYLMKEGIAATLLKSELPTHSSIGQQHLLLVQSLTIKENISRI